MESILDEAKRLTTQDRNRQYGPYDQEAETVALFWSEYLGYPIRPEQVPMMMALLKIAREKYKHKRDNLTDAVGYFSLKQTMHDTIDRRMVPPERK